MYSHRMPLRRSGFPAVGYLHTRLEILTKWLLVDIVILKEGMMSILTSCVQCVKAKINTRRRRNYVPTAMIIIVRPVSNVMMTFRRYVLTKL
jgi:hypothetical protein